MSDDRELLEAAARAAGMDEYAYCVPWRGMARTNGLGEFFGPTWNPLTDDGDALRLAVRLGLVVDCSRPSAGEPFKRHHFWHDELMDNETATRRAITRAAAAIGGHHD